MNFKTPFFSQKNLLAITASAFAIYTLVWCGVLIKSQIKHNQALQASKLQIERVKNLSPEEQSIRKAQNHLVDSITVVGTSERIFLSYLQRKFNLPDTLGANGPPIDLYEDPRTYPTEVHYLARIAYPDKIVKIPPKYELDDGVKVTNIYSANCDHLGLPDNYWQTVEQNIAKGGYYVAHVALAFAMMQDNGCKLPPNADDIRARTIQKLVGLAENSDTLADLRYEAVAFLLLSERRDSVKSQWIDQIIDQQLAGGGWSRETTQKKADAHATLLALWSLLEYSRPNTPNQPLIRHPG